MALSLTISNKGATGVHHLPRDFTDLVGHNIIPRKFSGQIIQNLLIKLSRDLLVPPILEVTPMNVIVPENEVRLAIRLSPVRWEKRECLITQIKTPGRAGPRIKIDG